jgi:hypothetical protein
MNANRSVTTVRVPDSDGEINLLFMMSVKTAPGRPAVRPVFLLPVIYVVAACLALCLFAAGQFSYPEQEIRIHDLPSLTARSTHASDVLATSLEIAFNDRQVCCGYNSALEEIVRSSDPKSLEDIANNLQGRHLLGDGRPIRVTAEYLPPNAVNSARLISMILSQQPPLMEWNSHLYVVCGVTYVETVDYSTGSDMKAIHKILLQDERFSDSRREVSFDRLSDDWARVQGLLSVAVALQ